MQSEGEIDTWNEITLDKFNSNLNEVDLPSDRELILAGVLTDNFKSYDEALEFAKKRISHVYFSLMKKATLQFIHKGWITNISAAQYMIDVRVSKSLMVIIHPRPITSAKFG